MNTESQHIEYKRHWKDDLLKWISGFANADGGVLVVGRDDDGTAVGVENATKLLEDIPNKVRDVLGILVDVNLVEAEGVPLIEIQVEAYPYPISYKGEYHYRTGSTKQELKGAALDRFLMRKQGITWDGVPTPRLTVEGLDKVVLQQFRKLAVQSQRLPVEVMNDNDTLLIERLRLTSGDYLKRATVLLFHPDPEAFVTGAYVKIGYFEHNHADLRYQDEIHGDLFKQVEQTIEVLKLKYFKALISYDGLYRVETYPVPMTALREAILNAVVHKDYASNIPIQISVYPNQLMIWNAGHLPERWTLDDLMGKHSSKPYNPDIANAFFRAGLVESWGRGVERIIQACVDADFPEPIYKLDPSGGLWTIFTYPESYLQQMNRDSRVVTPEATPEATPEVSSELFSLLQVIHGEMSRQEIMTALSLKDEKHFRESYQQVAIALGLIEMTLPDKPKSPKQKYRITAKGKQML